MALPEGPLLAPPPVDPFPEGLEFHHGPIRRDRADMPADPLSAAALDEFARHGFISGIPVLSPREVAELTYALDEILGALPRLAPRLYEIEAASLARPAEVGLHFLGAWRVHPVFHDLLWHPNVIAPLLAVFGRDRMRFFHDQVFAKPPRHPGVTPWHQDYSYWMRTAPCAHLTMNLMLDDTDQESGCVHFVPGSHRWPLFPKVDFGGPMDQLLGYLSREEKSHFSPVAAPLRAGQATIHHGMTVHGSFANAGSQPRRAVVLNFMVPEVVIADDQAPLLSGVPWQPRGEPPRGAFFPVLSARALS